MIRMRFITEQAFVGSPIKPFRLMYCYFVLCIKDISTRGSMTVILLLND